MTIEDCIIIGGSQLRWYLPSVAPRTSTVWYGVIFLSETRGQLVHRHNHRLTYNCAHLRSTKDSLTIEYVRIIKKIEVKILWVKFFLGENFLGENFLG